MNNISTIIGVSAIAITSFFNADKIYPDINNFNFITRFILSLLFAFLVIFIVKLLLSFFEYIRKNGSKIIKITISVIFHPIAKIIYLLLIFLIIMYLSSFDFYIVILCISALLISLSSIKWFIIKKSDFNDTFDSGMGSWDVITGNPTINQTFGKPAPNLDLSVVPGIRTNCFLELLPIETPEVGEIECDVYLETGSLFNIVLRGDIANKKWYMARLDSRNGDRDKDAFLKNNGNGWDFINTSSENSTPKIWHRMKIDINSTGAKLFKDGKLIAEMNDAELSGKKIGIFNEIGEVHIDNFTVRKK